QIAFAGAPFIQAFFHYLIRSLFGIKKKVILLTAYLYSFVFGILSLFWPRYLFGEGVDFFQIHYFRAKPMLVYSILIFVLLVALAFYDLIRFHRKAGGRQKLQAGYLIFGFGFGFLGGTSTLLPFLGVSFLYPLGNIGIFIYVCILAYAIMAHKLLNIELIIKRT